MIPWRKIVDYLDREAFRPFRINMASGQSFDVRHPEMVMIGKTTVRVFSPAEENDEGIDRWHDLSLVHMESIEPLDTSVHSN